ncbi:MAG: TetR/AcrR family transcriptional regulator [Faecalibacterium sp.]|jgi:AcrR family transcriptional regulator|nr:TetR/AcrR family transcriptional regulator [Faecalibacterium sp.]
MPKSYTESEKQQIDARLTACAQECIAQYGVRHTTVDELVRRAKIPKGTFYLFYPSKEALLIKVVFLLHDTIRADFVRSLKKMPQPVTADALAKSMLAACRAVEKTNLARIFVSGEMELLMRKIPPERMAQHIAEDDTATRDLIALLPAAAGQNAEAYSAAFRAAFLLTLHRKEIGPGFEKALRLVLRGIAIQMLGEST